MVRKVIDSFGYAGLVALLVALFYYSVYKQWDWRTQVLVYGGTGLIVAYGAANFSRIRAALGTRTARYGGAAGLSVLLVVGILVLANFLNFRHHKRIDLTENQLYSLSDQSRKIVENLEHEVEIIGFFTDESGRQRFQDLMSEYRYVSPKLQYEIVDPQENPGRAEQYEIQHNGQVVVLSGTKKELVDAFDEEKITNAVIKVTRKEEKVVYFLEGHGERDINDSEAGGLSRAKEAIEKQNYVVKTYNLAQENKLPEDATVLVSVAPRVNFFPNEEGLLKEYLQAGGKFLLLADPRTDFQMGDFLSQYGLGLGNKIVVDASGIGQLFGFGPAAPLVAEYADHPITRELQRVMTFFPLAQNVTTSDSPLGYQTLALLKTSANSWAESNLQEGRAAFNEGEDAEGPVQIAVVATHSASEKEESQEHENEEGGEEGDGEQAGTFQREARFVLFGDSDFAANAYFNTAANGDLFLMTVSWLAEEADLVAVRTRNPENRRIELTFSQSRLLFWGTVVLLPLVTLVFGISVWYRRR